MEIYRQLKFRKSNDNHVKWKIITLESLTFLLFSFASLAQSPAQDILTSGEPVVGPCAKTNRGQRSIGWGKFGLHFLVQNREVDVFGGKPDVDYVKYVIKPKKGHSALALWFGPYAAGQPDQALLNRSSDVRRADVTDSSGGSVGVDSRGSVQGKGIWRYFSVMGSSAIYEDATTDDGALFDKIISTACWQPYPRK